MGTVFPMPVNQGATWNRSAARAIAAAVALESRAAGCDRAFGPELQVATDPRWGRMQARRAGLYGL